jgi:2-dehydropantoate 2-reductase
MPTPSIAIVGAGAVGGYYGARLAQHGVPVHFLLRGDFDAVQRHGWQIRSCDGDFSLPPDRVNAYDDPADMPAVDLVIVTLKATGNDQFERLIAPLLKPQTILLTLQNGLGNEEQLAALFGPQRILGGLAFTCINRTAPGHIHHIDHGLIRLGEFNGGPSPRAQLICDLFNASGIHCQVLDSLASGRWEKLVWNIPFNGLGAAMDLSADRLIATSEGVELVISIMREVIATANAVGVPLDPKLPSHKIEHTRSMGAYLSSMQIDRRQGRPLETDAILSRPLQAARAAGLSVPRMEMVYRMVTLIDPAQYLPPQPPPGADAAPPRK